MKYSKKETKKEQEGFNLQELCVLWLNEGENGYRYLSGYDLNKNRIVGFFNKKVNDKQPTIRIYGLDEKGKLTDELITLWESESKKETTYLSGVTNEEEKVIGFYGNEKEKKQPYVRCYLKDE